MSENCKLLTIGQFSALHGINKKTLMWYDEIGLFQPAFIHPENGYRCYNYHQSPLLETILLLRELDVSIKEIQEFIKNRSAESLKCLLDEKIRELDIKMNHLKAVRKTLCNYHQNMETLMSMNLSEISMIDKDERKLITIDIDKEITYDREVEMVTAVTQKYRLPRLHDASYGTMISSESLYRGDFNNYTKLFIELPFSIPNTGLHRQPRGKYVRAFYKGNWDNMYQKYEEIFVYVQKQGLTLTGFSYERILNEIVTDCMDDYIVQIEIPVCE